MEGTLIKGVGGLYHALTPQGVVFCHARGLFRQKKITPLVGDRVRVALPANAETGTITDILPRQNALVRPRVANVDQVIFVLAAAFPAPDFTLLDHYLLWAEHDGINAHICFNKTDLATPEADIYQQAGYPVHALSATTGEGVAAFRQSLAGKVSALAGPSGVGKSSLINRLLNHTGEETMPTGTLSERIGRGKHTTRHAELLALECGGFIVDTPGFSSLDPPPTLPRERAALFPEFRPFLGGCKFSDCQHMAERDCAVKAQLGHAIAPARYQRYTEWMSKK